MSGESVPELLVKLRWALYQQFNVVVSRVKLYTRNDPKHPLCLPVPDGIVAAQEAAREHQAGLKGQLSPSPLMHRILKAVAGMDAEEPTIAEIAAAVKMRADPYLRKTLGAMRTLGFLGGVNGDAAFPITPKGLDCITGGNET